MSSHAQVRSTRIRHAWLAALNHRFRPRLGCLRWRGGSVMWGIIPALTMHVRLARESKPPSRWPEAPLRSKPTSWATRCKACRPSGNSPIAVSCTGATGTGAHTAPWVSVMALTFSPCSCLGPESPIPAPLVWPRGGSRRPGAPGERAAAHPREAAHGPHTPATASHHRPMGHRLWRRSCRAWPAYPRRRAARASPATASRGRGPTRGGARAGKSPGCPWAHAWGSGRQGRKSSGV